MQNQKDEKIIVLTETISRDINFQLLETALKQANLALLILIFQQNLIN